LAGERKPGIKKLPLRHDSWQDFTRKFLTKGTLPNISHKGHGGREEHKVKEKRVIYARCPISKNLTTEYTEKHGVLIRNPSFSP